MTQRPSEVLAAAYGSLAGLVASVDDVGSWGPTGCVGWSVRDLVAHCLADAQRGLVALHTTAVGPPDRTATTYWEGAGSDAEGDANGRRFTRVFASMFRDFRQLQDLHLETLAAVVDAVRATDESRVVSTQGLRLTVADLELTLAVEAAIHHLDLLVGLPDGVPPAAWGLSAARATLDGLLGHPSPVDWDDKRYVLVATGRATATVEEAAALGADLARLPLLS